MQRKIQRLITLLVFRCFVIIKRTENLQLLNIESGVPADVYPADTTKSPARRPDGFEILSPARRPDGFEILSPARRPGGFEIRRKKRFDLLKPGDLKSPNTDSSF